MVLVVTERPFLQEALGIPHSEDSIRNDKKRRIRNDILGVIPATLR